MKQLNPGELISFCSQLAMILHAGISVSEGLSIMQEDVPTKESELILGRLYEQMEKTGLLHESMKEVGVFPEYVIHMTEIGEQTGRLDEVMDGLTEHYEREEELTDNIKSALIYPVIMMGMMTAVVLVLIIKVMPVFQRVFEQMGGSLSGVSERIMNIGVLMSSYSMVFIAMLVIFIALIVFFAFTAKGRRTMKKVLERFVLTKGISMKIACSRVAASMNLCIRSGLDIDQGMELTQKLIHHRDMTEKLKQCRQMMLDGAGFDRALTETGVFSGVYAKMVEVGIRTGSVDQVMARIASDYDDEVARTLQQSVAMIEPTLVAVLSVMVGIILLSVMMPLMSIMANIG